mmetsp:Transcript_24413/g.52649  ORF Transcript_24413/g.52649 Transcript_24413/m.52649 type:complete len:156 (-) Transcript_24413:122-589(-)
MHEVWREELNSIKRLLMNLLLRKRDSRFGEEARRRTATWYTKAEPLPLAPTFLELIKLLLDVKRVHCRARFFVVEITYATAEPPNNARFLKSLPLSSGVYGLTTLHSSGWENVHLRVFARSYPQHMQGTSRRCTHRHASCSASARQTDLNCGYLI